jgi:hypothetical protein
MGALAEPIRARTGVQLPESFEEFNLHGSESNPSRKPKLFLTFLNLNRSLYC